jgi:hypothetical protein
VKNNLISYLIYYTLDSYKSSIDIGIANELFQDGDSPILNSCRKYRIKFKTADLKFIDTTYTLFSFSWGGEYWDYCPDTISIKGVLDTNTIMYRRIKDFNNTLCYSTNNIYRRYFKHQLLENGLVAWKSCREILFCNGGFESNIEYLYFKDGFEEERFLEYIKVRCYNMKPTDIKIDLTNRTATFFSEALNCKAKLTIVDTDSEYYKYFYKIEEIE